MRMTRFASRLSTSTAVVSLLSAAVLATAALSWEAVRSSRHARDTAEGVLRDYASIAATQFVREAHSRLEARLASGFTAIRHLAEDHKPRQIHETGDCDCGVPASAETTFVLSNSGTTFSQGRALEGAPLLAAQARLTVAPGRERPVVQLIDTRIVAMTTERVRMQPAVLGFVSNESWLKDVFDQVTREAALLPGTLVKTADTANVLALRVSDQAGRVRFRFGGTWSGFTGTADLEPRLGGFRVEAAIQEDAAGSLVIGGLPAERWPIVAALLVLAVGLVVTAAVQLQREARFARQRADFISGVSHELRTPLAQIRLFGETLLLGRVRSAEEEQRAAAVIVQEAQRLEQMVDNVLQFSRSGRMVPGGSRELLDPVEIASDVIEGFRPLASSKRARITLTADDIRGPMSIDANALRQVLINLLDNAVKYGPPQQTIQVGLSGADGQLRVSVEDQGTGVPAEDRDHIWEPFWRAPGSPEGGTGLGLAIVRELMRQQNGDAIVETGAGGGARFIVTLPA